MSEEASWNPASGCFQCPISMDLGLSWASPNPLPGFADIGRGYFSVPLRSWYLPLPFSAPYGAFVIGEVANTHVGKFFAIADHEGCHIEMGVLDVKGLTRLAAGRAWQALFEIMSGSNSKAWENLQQWNSSITKLIKSIALIEELTATLLGCAYFREMSSELSHQVEADRIEEEFVRTQTEFYGPDFKKIYGKLAQIYHNFGNEPIKILTRYSMDWLEVEHLGKEVMEILVNKINEETTKSRLDRCLELFRCIRLPPEAQHWTKDNWYHFFELGLVDFRRWRAGRDELQRFLAKDFALSKQWWADRGFHDLDNPLFTAEWITNVSNYAIKVQPVLKTPPIENAEDSLHQQIIQDINERLRVASAQNRTLVAISTLKIEGEETFSMGFVPRIDKNNQEAIPFARPMICNDPPRPREESFQVQIALRRALSALLFFEGLRRIAADGDGVRCPVRSIEWAEHMQARWEGNKLPACCGRNKELIAFWEAGKKAKDRGLFQTRKWEYPHECM